MDYDNLLNNNETLLLIKPSVKVDLRDYVYLSEKCLPHGAAWENIRSYIITTNNRTIWELSEQHLNSDSRPIGWLEPPVTLIRWILQTQLLLGN